MITLSTDDILEIVSLEDDLTGIFTLYNDENETIFNVDFEDLPLKIGDRGHGNTEHAVLVWRLRKGI
jgi:hypothetical protein